MVEVSTNEDHRGNSGNPKSGCKSHRFPIPRLLWERWRQFNRFRHRSGEIGRSSDSCRSEGRRLGSPMEFGNVRADGKLNQKLGCFFFCRVVLRKSPSDLTSFHSNNWVLARIVGRGAMKQVYSNRTLFQVIGVTREDLLDDIGEKFLRPGTVAECMAALDLRQLAQDVGMAIPS